MKDYYAKFITVDTQSHDQIQTSATPVEPEQISVEVGSNTATNKIKQFTY